MLPGRRRVLALACGLAAATLLRPARSQIRLRRVALVALGPIDQPPLRSLIEGLREAGHEQDRNLEFLAPPSGAGYTDLPRMAKAALERGAEVIVAYGASATTQARAATSSVPIVMVVGGDPVELGFVANLARPEANVTGLATSTQVLIGKRVELLREMVPRLRRVGALWNSSSKGQSASLKVLQAAAAQLGLEVQPIDLRGRRGVEGVGEALRRARPDALMPLAATTLGALGEALLALAAEQRLPAIYSDAALVRRGGLVSYSPDANAQLRRAAHYVDRLLKGARPAELPVEQPTKFELAINMRTAMALGLAVPPGVLLRADHVVE